jgi:GntR family transcriptional regulator
MFSLNPQSAIPIYRQLVEQVRRMIAGGQLKPGDDLPSVRELALVHTLNPMTISKAYSLLEAEGLLLRLRGKPMQVAPANGLNLSQEARLRHLRPPLQALVQAARQLQLDDALLVQVLQEALAQEPRHSEPAAESRDLDPTL